MLIVFKIRYAAELEEDTDEGCIFEIFFNYSLLPRGPL